MVICGSHGIDGSVRCEDLGHLDGMNADVCARCPDQDLCTLVKEYGKEGGEDPQVRCRLIDREDTGIRATCRD